MIGFLRCLSYDFRSIIASLAGALVREISRAAHPAWWTCMNFLLRFKSASCTVCGGLDDRWPSGFARRATRCRYFSHKSTYRPTGCCASELRGKGHTACACTLGTILELRLAPELYRQFGLALVSLVALRRHYAIESYGRTARTLVRSHACAVLFAWWRTFIGKCNFHVCHRCHLPRPAYNLLTSLAHSPRRL